MDVPALLLTLKLAAVTTAILLLLAAPIALWIAARPSWPRRIVQALCALPLLLPPTVIGFYLLVGLGPETALGRSLTGLLGHTLAFSFEGLVVGSVIFSLPFAVQPLVSGFRAVDPELAAVAATLGASPRQVFRRITFPLARPAFLTAALLVFTHTVGEFGVVLMLGGNIPGVTRTLSISLFDQVQESNYAAAGYASLLLVGVSFLALIVLFWSTHKQEAAHA